ncbi:hypothetical protein Golob_020608 [Gossypium lobatum]|uniref:Uncharacterized protein n=1 Tax=Gossypium lobatum TaxID=34289 RepID=A0A7J8LAY1_9ROSI|nr:hypothetical protein [Gossypium lobatum]
MEVFYCSQLVLACQTASPYCSFQGISLLIWRNSGCNRLI